MSMHTYDINGISIEIESVFGVSPPSPFSVFLAQGIRIDQGAYALDLGCGSGLQSIVMAKEGAARVVGVDTNGPSVRATRHNARLNHCESSIRALEGSLYDPVAGERFDIIVSNPPTLPAGQSTPKFCHASEQGRGFVDRLISGASDHLRPDGTLYLVHSSLANIDLTLERLRSNGLTPDIQKSQWVPFRPFYFEHLRFFVHQARLGYAFYRLENGEYLERVDLIRARF